MIFSRANITTFFTSLAIQSCGMVTGILTARILGPTARGELATVMLWPIILSNLGLLGCNWALARAVASNPEAESNQVCSALALGLAASTAFAAFGYFFLPLVLP
ncbi:MAG: oligosaccharide flippase family protein, partial [Candidatus Acidiferrales bacterium]